MKQTYWTLLAVALFAIPHAYADSHETNRDVMKADANHDGRVSFEEFKAAHDAKMRERFKRKDVNGDGYIDLEEKQVAKAKRKEKQKAKIVEERKELREKYDEERKRRKKHFYKYR